MAFIQLSQKAKTIVDDGDFEWLSKFKWYLAHGYAQRSQMFGSRTNGTRFVRTYRMHREIMKPCEGMEIDHKNGDRLDNRRANLRLATHAQNIMNTRVSQRNKLGIKGVSKRYGKFVSRIRVNRKLIHLGCFDTSEQAHRKYIEAAREHFGEFARAS